MDKKEIGRPKKQTEKKVSTTLSILPSTLKKIEKRHKSLTKYIEYCSINNLI